MSNRFAVVVNRFIMGLVTLWLGGAAPLLASEMVVEEPSLKGFRVGVTQAPMYTLASALAYGSLVETVLVQRDESGDWKIPEDITVLFWSGAALEPELAKQLAVSAQASVDLMDAAGVHQLAKRTPAHWKPPGDDDPHMESMGKGYGMVQTIRPEGEIDTYYWLDPLNTMAALEAITMVFQGLDQRNHWGYQANSDQIVQALWELDIRLSKHLHEVAGKPFMVLQDELQYLEQRYRLSTIPVAGSAEEIVKRAKMREVKCVVATQPIAQPLLAALDQSGLNAIVLDPAGKRMSVGTGAYFKWFGGMISELRSCILNS